MRRTEFTEEGEQAMNIKDSGNRTEFKSGAVRDIQEGKGRCDLLPFDVVSDIFAKRESAGDLEWVFHYLSVFTETGEWMNLVNALAAFKAFHDVPTMILEVSKHFEDGAHKYGERNWEKGIPVSRYIDSSVRHLLKHSRGDTDERHDRAFCWNIMCAIWTCKHKPELNEFLVD